MIENTEITAEKLEEIRQRYRPTEVPECHICGAEMTIQRMSASRITYGCAGAIYDETGCHYAEGRSLADDHYAESRITVVDASDPDVLALVEALEKAQTINAAAEKLVRCKGRYHSEQNYRALAALFGVNTPDLPPLDGECSTVTVKLPQAVSAGGQGYQAQVERILTAAGIKVEAE
ncbi:ead/Ea22-like family protein [Klebsiella oxytoca]|uniref:ead/Ea22-like family protein n=1 Tax=Klebsiella oxytoca TaxID=571 RepID=UPI002591A258|nr:ead/Ea22-like family protein [Klebsiella oxytoca]MDM4191151.1 ead/Ea22-like family protein [Klebsiella oxytoca]MDN4994292.1 ead/Ea22-like family protein [Klebsiella oxytoca]